MVNTSSLIQNTKPHFGHMLIIIIIQPQSANTPPHTPIQYETTPTSPWARPPTIMWLTECITSHSYRSRSLIDRFLMKSFTRFSRSSFSPIILGSLTLSHPLSHGWSLFRSLSLTHSLSLLRNLAGFLEISRPRFIGLIYTMTRVVQYWHRAQIVTVSTSYRMYIVYITRISHTFDYYVTYYITDNTHVSVYMYTCVHVYVDVVYLIF